MLVSRLGFAFFLVPSILFTLESPVAAQARAGGVAVSGNAGLARCLGRTPGHPRDASDFEPSAAVDPGDSSHLAVSWMTVLNDDHVSIRVTASRDAGRTWSRPFLLPFTECAGGPAGAVYAVDPWVTIGPDGRVYLSALAAIGPPVPPTATRALRVVVATSGDGGATWDPPRVVADLRPPVTWADNTSITADPSRPGTAYVLVTRGRTPQSVIDRLKQGLPVDPLDIPRAAAIAKTVDGGRTWSSLRPVSPDTAGFYADCPQLVVGRRSGRLYLFYSRGNDGGEVSMQTSDDAGKTWSAPSRVIDYVALRDVAPTGKIHATAEVGTDIIHPAIDPETERLVVVFTDGRWTAGAGSVVSITSSSDSGRTWTPAARIASPEAAASWLPAVTVGPRSQVGVSYAMTPRATQAAGAIMPTEFHVASFTLSAAGAPEHLTDAVADRFDYRRRPAHFQLGHYHALVRSNDRFLPVYVKLVPGANGSVGRIFIGR